MKDIIRTDTNLDNTHHNSKDFSKLKYKKRLQEHFIGERESKQIKIEQQKEERDFRAEKRATAKAEQAEKNPIVQLTRFSKELPLFQTNVQKFIDSKRLTGKTSSEAEKEEKYLVQLTRFSKQLPLFQTNVQSLHEFIESKRLTGKISGEAEKDPIVQITWFSEQLPLFQTNMRNLQKFIESQRLTGKISSEAENAENALLVQITWFSKESRYIQSNIHDLRKFIESKRLTEKTSSEAENAENALLVQRTQLSKKLRDFQASVRNLQESIESNQLTGKISSKTNELIKNCHAVIKEAKDTFNGHNDVYKKLDNFRDIMYTYIGNNANINKYNILNGMYIGVINSFNDNIAKHKHILNEIEKINPQLSKELSSLAKSLPSTDQPLPQHQQNSQQEQAILSSLDHQREKFMVEQIQKVDREIRSHFQPQAQEFERQRHELQEKIIRLELKIKSRGNEKTINDFSNIKQKFERANNHLNAQLKNDNSYNEGIFENMKFEIQSYKTHNGFQNFKRFLERRSDFVKNICSEHRNLYINYIYKQNQIISELNSIELDFEKNA